VSGRVATGVHLSAADARYLARKARRAHARRPIAGGLRSAPHGRTSRSAWPTLTTSSPALACSRRRRA
jgi:hypothetical protein